MIRQEFDFSVDILKALLWQYESSDNLKSLLQSKKAWYDENQRDFWANWYRDVFNVDTANDFGLSVWARILNVSLGIDTASTVELPHFGFGPNHQNFNNGPFARAESGQQGLSTEQKRLVIKMRFFQLTTNGSVPQTNEFLAEVFKDYGQVYVMDSLTMDEVIYFFRFTPDARLRMILDDMDLLARPAAVGVKYIIEPRPAFGFGVYHLNFNNGSFGA